MNAENAVAKPRGRAFKLVGKGLLILIVSLATVYFVGRLVWRFSGSNQWELVQEGNGAKVYALKAPGSDLKLYKGVTRVHTTLNRAVAWLQDPETCREVRCLEPKTIAKVDDQLQYVSMQMNMPGPLRRREFVMRYQFHQIPSTKEVWVEYAADPDKAPPNDCCVRVTDMANTWRLTPIGNGQIELEYVMNMDWGGFLPDYLSNRIRPRFMFRQLQHLEAYMNKEKYRTAKFDFIQEDTSGATVTASANTLGAAGQGAVRVP